MLNSVHDTCESKTWVPNVCPKFHPACGPLQNMQTSKALGHCVSVIPTMPPSPLSTAFRCSCTWSWLRVENTFAFLCELICRWTYYRHYTRCHICTEDSHPSCGSDPWSKTTQFQHACPSLPPPPYPTPHHHHHHHPPTTTTTPNPRAQAYQLLLLTIIYFFGIRNEAYLGLPIYQF